MAIKPEGIEKYYGDSPVERYFADQASDPMAGFKHIEEELNNNPNLYEIDAHGNIRAPGITFGSSGNPGIRLIRSSNRHHKAFSKQWDWEREKREQVEKNKRWHDKHHRWTVGKGDDPRSEWIREDLERLNRDTQRDLNPKSFDPNERNKIKWEIYWKSLADDNRWGWYRDHRLGEMGYASPLEHARKTDSVHWTEEELERLSGIGIPDLSVGEQGPPTTPYELAQQANQSGNGNAPTGTGNAPTGTGGQKWSEFLKNSTSKGLSRAGDDQNARSGDRLWWLKRQYAASPFMQQAPTVPMTSLSPILDRADDYFSGYSYRPTFNQLGLNQAGAGMPQSNIEKAIGNTQEDNTQEDATQFGPDDHLKDDWDPDPAQIPTFSNKIRGGGGGGLNPGLLQFAHL